MSDGGGQSPYRGEMFCLYYFQLKSDKLPGLFVNYFIQRFIIPFQNIFGFFSLGDILYGQKDQRTVLTVQVDLARIEDHGLLPDLWRVKGHLKVIKIIFLRQYLPK